MSRETVSSWAACVGDSGQGDTYTHTRESIHVANSTLSIKQRIPVGPEKCGRKILYNSVELGPPGPEDKIRCRERVGVWRWR